ncbi:MAG: TM2 domain-containing protein [Flavobacteriales bacterium]|nr:TM2 domain-containing protein [Flavobacteriales bacterium]
MMRSLLIAIILLVFSPTLSAQKTPDRFRDRVKPDSKVGKIFFAQVDENSFVWKGDLKEDADSTATENPRLVAIVLNVTLGVFGMHRIYLGTDVKVPVFYTLTLGGGMALWVIDLGFLLFSKDISRFQNNPGIFMWAGNESRKKEKG